jgi:hypothetical protein
VTLGRSVVILVVLVTLAVSTPGCARRLAFATATTFGIDVSQQADQSVQMSLGYDRAETVVMPAEEKGVSDATDTYAVLGTFQVKHGNPFANQALIIHQFFATGRAAIRAAETEQFQRLFGAEAADIYATGSAEVKK